MWQDKPFHAGDSVSAAAAMQELAALIDTVKTAFENLGAKELLMPPAPGKWSRQQVLGHLADSALNNLKRFTDAQLLQPPYPVAPYNQDGLVEANNYGNLPLTHILNLWQALNRQIIFVVENIPASRLACMVRCNGGDQTLEWLICDYVVHLKHHLHAMGLL